jgi:tetratricopeptide (TPR) repeat protein
MPTRLSIFCEKIIEAGWLSAVIVVPLFFNVLSSRVFEPDKLSLLRSIALVMVVAWLVKSLEQFVGRAGGTPAEGGGGIRAFLLTPLVLPTLLLAVVYVLTTVTSLVPSISFWGSYPRLQGTYTFFSYVVIFLLMLRTLRSRQQVERLLTVIIVTSFPIALYGIVQHFQLDPLPWGGDVTARVASNMGNAIFVAAYLIMVVPITIGRFVINLHVFEVPASPGEEGRRAPNISWTIGYGLLLALQALCLAYVFIYLLFFLSDVEHKAGGLGYGALLASGVLASLSMVLFSTLISPRVRVPNAAWVASRVLLFAGQSLALSYFLLLIFRLNYVVVTGGVATEFVALGAVMLLFVVSFWFAFREEAIGPHLLGVLYGFVLSIQLMCIFFTKSRGPWIGLAAGLFVLVFVFGVRRRMTWLWVTAASAGVAGILFLAVLNVPGSPLAGLRQIPYIGRLGEIFDTETGTGKVRVLIWQGVVDLISPHEPIGLPPDHLDGLNAIRPLVGYGPEAMFVAYNRFYPPELAHYEARNASPDRAHNETFDALAMTGWVGFLAYMALFGSLFYYGLKWLGFVVDRRQRILYIVLWSLGGILFAVGARLLDGSWRFSGVALAVGITFGFLVYLVIHALALRGKAEVVHLSFRDQVLLIALLSAIVAHFIEIHFGIAIAATKTYFWVYCALLVVIGLSRWEPTATEQPTEQTPQPQASSRRSRKNRRRTRPEQPGEGTSRLASLWRGIDDLMPLCLLLGLVMATLGYDHVTGMFQASAKGFSVPWLLALTWLCGGAIIIFEWRIGARRVAESGIALPLLTYFVVSLGIFAVFTVIHYSRVSYEPEIKVVDDLVSYSRMLANTVVVYFLALFTIMLLVALALAARTPRPALQLGRWPSVVAAPLLALGVAVLILSTNVNIVRADVHYKNGREWGDLKKQWDVAMALYEESIRLARDQDWYYLFLAGSMLEKGKTISDDEGRVSLEPQSVGEVLRLAPTEMASLDRDSLFRSAYLVLTRARAINPLNTDHSANLARLFNAWAQASSDAQERAERWQQALRYYEDATTLSPHNAELFDQWGMVYLATGQNDEAIAKYEVSLELDPEFAETYLLLADAQTMSGNTEAAVEAYQKALDLDPRQVKPHIQLCALLGQQGKLEEAAQHCQQALELSPNEYQAHRNLAIIYKDMGRTQDALTEARIARELASEDEKQDWDSFIAQLEATAE